MISSILTEIPPVSREECFAVFERHKTSFNFPIHVHSLFELNYIENAAGAQRIVGDHTSEIDDLELVLITGPTLEHAWVNHNCRSNDIYEITIQMSADLFEGGMFRKKQFRLIARMLERATHGIAFSRRTILSAKPLLDELLASTDTFNSMLIFLRLLHTLSLDGSSEVLSHQMFSSGVTLYDSRRVKLVMEYLERHYSEHISLSTVAALVNMSPSSFSRFIKLRTGNNFIDCLNEIRVSAVARLLVDEPTNSVADIAYRCGFNNISNFNRIFKRMRGFTPQQFREQFVKKRIII